MLRIIRITHLFLFLVCITYTVQAQETGVITGSFETNANAFIRDSSIYAFNTPQYDRQLFGGEAWLNLNYQIQGFTIATRFDMFYNSNLRNPNASYSDAGIGMWSISKSLNFLDISVGYLYDQIGSGIVFRAFETRPLFIDNALYGARLQYNFDENWHLMAFAGKQKNAFDTYSGNIKGLRTEGFISAGSEENPITLAPGLGFVNKTLSDEYMNGVIDVLKTYQNEDKFTPEYNSYAATIYNTLAYKGLNLYTEFALKSRDVLFNPYIEKTELVGSNTLGKLVNPTGAVTYISASYSTGNLGVTAEMKRTKNFTFRVDPNLTLLKGTINYLTPISRQNTYRLTARYTAPALDISEMAYNLDIRYRFSKALSANVNLTDIKTLEGEKLYQELYTELVYKHNRKWQLNTGVQLLTYNQEIYETKAEVPLIKAIVPYADFLYKFTPGKSLRIESQYMSTQQDYGSWLFGLLEYNIAPRWSFEASGMYNIDPKKPDINGDLKKILYPTLGVTFFKDAQRYSLRYVKQVEGVVCSGGICRLEPAFSGIRFSMNTTF